MSFQQYRRYEGVVSTHILKNINFCLYGSKLRRHHFYDMSMVNPEKDYDQLGGLFLQFGRNRSCHTVKKL
jgi:hypothetical protein